MTAMTATIPLLAEPDRNAAQAARPLAAPAPLAALSDEPLPAMVYRSEAFAEDLYGEMPLERRSAAFSAGVGTGLSAGMARIWSTVPLGIALAAGIGLPWTLPH
jgi:hypothetical protein